MADSSIRLPGSQVWLRRYPPLVALAIALLIAFLVLPSALNIPQSNPTTVLEFAPVPPDDEDTPPPQEGSLSTLGLGSSDSLNTGGQDLPDSGPIAPGKGLRPITKKCIGDPPRQTEDPNSPPCVPFFEGDNGGSTWQGVTKDEITVLVYRSASINTSGSETPTSGTYCDVDGPADSDDNCLNAAKPTEDHEEVRTVRAMAKYFNDRFQTYNRHVHFYIYWTPSSATASSRRADAQGNWETLKPFAVIDRAFFGGFNAVYAEAMVRRRSQVYGNFSSLANEYFRKNAPYIWSFWPDVEHAVDQYVTYVCSKVAPFPTTFAGDDRNEIKLNGKPRKYAYLSTNDPLYEGLEYYADVAKEKFKRPCPGSGIKISDLVVEDLTFPRHQYQTDTNPEASQAGQENIARLKTAKVTTVLWLQGYETEHGKAALQSNYFPEWVVAGDLLNDGTSNNRAQEQEVWRHAWFVSNTLREDRVADTPCRQAYREVEPNGRQFDEDEACSVYRAFFMFYRSIQSAGAFLSPDAVDQGNHAIPRQSSKDPYVAACYYDPGDYSCVKDAQESWYDPDAPDPDGQPDERGCLRLVNGGKRVLTGEWSPGQSVFQNRTDPCNNVSTDTFINPYGPAG